jgi:ubiquitin-like 1-activating enzyme E1 A
MELSEAEAELYDRQIRLWGLDSQKRYFHLPLFQNIPYTFYSYRLRCARILLIGLKGFGAEIAKNIILAGVKSVTLLDSESLSRDDTRAQFLAPPDAVGTNVRLCMSFSPLSPTH